LSFAHCLDAIGKQVHHTIPLAESYSAKRHSADAASFRLNIETAGGELHTAHSWLTLSTQNGV